MTDIAAGQTERPPITRAEAVKVWLRVALLSFGGPASQIAVMHRILVDEKKWISEHRFLHALNFCMLLPGPEAQQLATYMGWLMHRTWGGLTAGLLFIAPGFMALLALSMVYGAYGQHPWMTAVFYGLKAAILAVVIEAVLRIGKRALNNSIMVLLAGSAFVALFFFHVAFPLVIIVAAVFGIVAQRLNPDLCPAVSAAEGHGDRVALIDRAIVEGHLPHTVPHTQRTIRTAFVWLSLWLAPLLLCWLALGPDHIFTILGTFFAKVAAVTFGGAYAVLAYVAQQAVDFYGWLRPGEMLDGLALAETTPGPLIMVLQFVGYIAAARTDTGLSPMLAGVGGSVLTVWMVFTPSFLWIFTGAPYIEALLGRAWLRAALSSITAAIVGVILNLSVWFALHVVFRTVTDQTYGPITLSVPDWASLDLAAAAIAAGCMIAILKFHKGIGVTLAVAALVGFVWKMIAA